MDDIERRLILAIQRAPIEDSAWQDFLRELRLTLHGNLANIVFRLPLADDVHGMSISDAPDAPDWLFERGMEFRHLDPMPYFTMTPGKVYAYEEFDTVKALAYDAFREQFNVPAGFYHLIIFKVVDASGAQIWVTVTRACEQAPFDQDERALCERLAAHLSVALTTHTVLTQMRRKIDVYARAAGMLSFGVIGIDPQGDVISLDHTAARAIRETGLLHVSRNRLYAAEDDQQLQKIIAEALRSGADAHASSINLGGVQGLDLLVLSQDVRPDLGPRQPRLLIYLSRPGQPGHRVADHLQRLFGLTKTQAKLAAGLASGSSLTEAATRIGITEQTARTYTKEIYAKMGVSRQGEMIQRILTSVVMLDGAMNSKAQPDDPIAF